MCLDKLLLCKNCLWQCSHWTFLLILVTFSPSSIFISFCRVDIDRAFDVSFNGLLTILSCICLIWAVSGSLSHCLCKAQIVVELLACEAACALHSDLLVRDDVSFLEREELHGNVLLQFKGVHEVITLSLDAISPSLRSCRFTFFWSDSGLIDLSMVSFLLAWSLSMRKFVMYYDINANLSTHKRLPDSSSSFICARIVLMCS